ncbi:MAG: tryptophan 7-halogenase [Asticcacaulis sp.]
MLADPRPLRFKSGRRTASWTKNCIAVGLASGFLEPLESTSIYLSQIAITNLLELFPARQIDPALRDEFNRRVDVEYDRVRDFLILHYHANTRDDGELWAYTRTMPIPDSLVERIEQFRHRGHVTRYRDGLFSPVSWIAVLAGQGILPEGYDRTVDNLTDAALENKLNDLESRINSSVDLMNDHAGFIRGYCLAPLRPATERAKLMAGQS